MHYMVPEIRTINGEWDLHLAWNEGWSNAAWDD
jgi:hypothetical protein